MIQDYFRFAVDGIVSRKVRSWLTMLGIFVGIAAVVALISLGQGMQNAISYQFERVGSNRIIVAPGSRFMGPGGGGMVTAKLTEDDLDIVRQSRGVDISAGVYVKSAKIEFEGQTRYLSIQGFPLDSDAMKVIERTAYFDIDNGRQLRDSDNYGAVLGQTVAEDYFDEEVKVGDTLVIEGYEFSVVGIQKKAGTGIHDIVIRIPLDTARDIFDKPDEVSMIFALTKDGFEPYDVAEEMRKELRKYRDVEEDEEDFTVQTAQQAIESFSIILTLVQVVLVGIAAISLVVGGIGIMNTMYTSVLERTRDIGIMKAIGARNSDIGKIFLIESGLLGFVGGLIGLLLGMSMSFTVQLIAQYYEVPGLQAYFAPVLCCGALIFSFLVGAVSGVLPAMQAAKMNPVEALRK